jgi:hypothetical protein
MGKKVQKLDQKILVDRLLTSFIYATIRPNSNVHVHVNTDNISKPIFSYLVK